jgi:N-hydroxyarylamine O-acetyltransferase
MKPSDSDLPEELVERILDGLGLSRRPEPTPHSLATLYAAWCERIPFDNVRKLIAMRADGEGPMPGSTAEDFFENWLKFGTGGTCWAGAGACHALLNSLGFRALRGVATMLVVPGLPPNHGTVSVTFDDGRYLVDCSILHGEPLRLEEDLETRVEHPAHGVRCSLRDKRWHVSWKPLHKVDGLDCRLERFGAKWEEFASFHGQTRAWSPFNYELNVRINRGDSVVGAAFGHAVSLNPDGSASRKPISQEERVRLLVDDIGMSEEIASRLPADTPTPPPPWSETAAQGGKHGPARLSAAADTGNAKEMGSQMRTTGQER